ncbi:hypothetical protein EVAR_3447_1 [Eumeta japonica]|uniref:Uncharacterized protein n=1 Tax=Eumeta variegata TaxID=151549 RepID=A0A4C1SV88_EUMVA|nr:hypothetical protein EVAR_3447_1 [Eumeta japonica]
MKASEQINDGASTPVAGATDAMQADDIIASTSTLNCAVSIKCEHRLLKSHLAVASHSRGVNEQANNQRVDGHAALGHSELWGSPVRCRPLGRK